MAKTSQRTDNLPAVSDETRATEMRKKRKSESRTHLGSRRGTGPTARTISSSTASFLCCPENTIGDSYNKS